jgi:uncharacterized protein YecT (DUF1311 family)
MRRSGDADLGRSAECGLPAPARLARRQAAESVRQAERAWIAARDADCKVPYDIYEGGTMARLDGANCVLEHTATRVLQLHVWQNMAKPE